MLSVKVVYVMIISVVNLSQLCNCNRNCILFKHGNGIIRARKGSYTKLTFSVASSCIPGSTRIDGIGISIFNATASGHNQAFCQIVLHKDGTCPSRKSQDCHCSSESGEYSVRLHTTVEAQCVFWKISVGFQNGSKSLSKLVKLHIEDSDPFLKSPPKVKNVTIQRDNLGLPNCAPNTAQPGSRVTVSCSWDEGFPPRTARLLRHDNREELKAVESLSVRDGCLRHLDYVFEKVQCRDMGKFSCQAPGASTNASQVLLVKCEPTFLTAGLSFGLTGSGHVPLLLPVRVHERNITFCRLVRGRPKDPSPPQTDTTAATGRNSSLCHKPELLGELPDVFLKTWMTNVTSSSEGEWTLEMTNDGGTGSVHFFLKAQRKKQSTMVLVGAAIGSVAFCVLVAIICVAQCKRKGFTRRPTQVYRVSHPPQVPPPRPPEPVPRKPTQAVDPEPVHAVAYHVTPLDSEVNDCDSCLIDRIYNEIKDHAIRTEMP